MFDQCDPISWWFTTPAWTSKQLIWTLFRGKIISVATVSSIGVEQ